MMLQLPDNHVSNAGDGVKVSGGIQPGATYVNTSDPDYDCSGCHDTNYNGWSVTKHAWAWPGLMNGTFHPDSCKPCHSTGAGKPSFYPDTGLDVTTGLPTYLQNVTCQSCHGPASNHIAAPFDGAARRASISMPLNASLCGSCHSAGGNISAEHHPTYDEWQLSGHNTTGSLPGYITSNPDCSNCHEVWNAIKHVETGTYRTEMRLAGEDAEPTWEISCAVCHDPHSLGSANTQLRLPADQLCQRCHTQEDAEPGKAVHHPQAEVRNNTAGYLVDREDMDYMEGLACSKCHMAENNAGLPNHTFNPNPYSCVTCHGAPEYPDNATAEAYIGMIRSRTVENITEIQPLVNQASALVEQMMGNRSNVLDTYRNEYNISIYNLDTIVNDKSSGNHNPELAVALLNDSRTRANSVIGNLTPPDKVAGVTATAGEEGVIEIHWTANAATDFAKYRIYVLMTSKNNLTSDTWTQEVTGQTTTSLTIEEMDLGTYYVYVTAVDDDGNEITNPLSGTAVTLEEEEEEPEEPGGISSEVLAGIVILLAAIVIVVAALMMRKRKGKEPVEPEKKEE